MPFTAKLGTVDSRPGNIVPGLGSQRFIPSLTTATPASLVVEVAFPNNPIDLTGYRNAILGDGPSLYSRMDSTTSCADQSGNANTMTLVNVPTLTTSALSGDSNQALSFNGTDESGVVTSSPSISPSGAFSVERWVKFASAPGTNRNIDGKPGSWRLELRTDAKIQFLVRGNSSSVTLVSATTLSTNTYYHVICVYDGANVFIYLNGVQDATTAYSGGVVQSANPLLVARTDQSSASPANRANQLGGGGPASSISIRVPAGAVAGDGLICFFIAKAGMIITPPSGETWVLLGTTPAQTNQVYAYAKICQAADPNQFKTWTFDQSSSYVRGVIAAFSGVSSVSPTGAIAANSIASGATTTTTLLPAYDNTLVITCAATNTNTGGVFTISPGTEQLDVNGTGFASNAVGASSSQSLSVTNSQTSFETHLFGVELVGAITTSSFSAVTVDEVSFWNFALSPAQTLAHFQQASVSPAAITWTDISADVRECKISRGRQAELDQIQAGTATLLLKDGLRNYDPANTLGAYAPNVKPLRMIRIRALFNSVNYPLFRGYVERWESSWETGTEQFMAEAVVTAVDGFEPLSLSAPTGSVAASASGVTIGSLLNKANWPGDQRVLDGGAFNAAAITLDGSTSVLSYLQTVANGEAGLFFIDASGNAVFHDKNHRSTNSLSTTAQALFGDVPDGSLPYTALESPSSDKDKIFNDWHVDDSSGGDHQATDTTSITAFFRRTQNRSTLLSPTDAATMAAFLLSRTKDPGYRVDAIELTPGTALEVWTQALNREISDRITVEAQPIGIIPAAQMKKDFWIERVEWTWKYDEPNSTRVRWQLSPAT